MDLGLIGLWAAVLVVSLLVFLMWPQKRGDAPFDFPEYEEPDPPPEDSVHHD